MIEISKVDYFFEPLVFILELFARIIGRIILRDELLRPIENWSSEEWAWVIGCILALLLIPILIYIKYIRKREYL